MTSRYIAVLLLSLVLETFAQIVGQDVCVCSPGAYEITLDFSLICPPTNITDSDPGIGEVSCLVSQFGSPGATDLVPASVDRIDVLEIREDTTLIVRNEITGPLNDGDTITYTTNPIGSTADIPFGIQFNTHAFNAAGEPLLNVLSIQYTNECDVYPVIMRDQTAGWLQFTRLDPPQSGFCPISEAGAPTVASSFSPSTTPTIAGSSPPTILVVTGSPTTTPPDSLAPTTTTILTSDFPTLSASPSVSTVIPSESPSGMPSGTPTEVPVPSPTEAPIASPTEAPVTSPTEAPVALPTEAPIPSPTEPPVDPPVAEPTPSTSPNLATDMPIQGGMSMSMSMVMMDMVDMLDMEVMFDMEEALDSAVEQYEEFGRGRMGGEKSSKKSSKKYVETRKAEAPTPKSTSESYRGAKKSSKRMRR